MLLNVSVLFLVFTKFGDGCKIKIFRFGNTQYFFAVSARNKFAFIIQEF
jgi:hypothetical protein